MSELGKPKSTQPTSFKFASCTYFRSSGGVVERDARKPVNIWNKMKENIPATGHQFFTNINSRHIIIITILFLFFFLLSSELFYM